MKKLILFIGLPLVTLMLGVSLGQHLRHLGLAAPTHALVAVSAAGLGAFVFHRFWCRHVLRTTPWHGPLIFGLLAVAFAVMFVSCGSLWMGE